MTGKIPNSMELGGLGPWKFAERMVWSYSFYVNLTSGCDPQTGPATTGEKSPQKQN